MCVVETRGLLMEYQVQSEVIDKIKIRYGLVLNVNKYGGALEYMHNTMNTKNSKMVCKGIYKSKVEIENRYKGTKHPVGTYFVHGNPVALVDPQDYTYEVKVSGGTISGSANDVVCELEDIIKAIKKYQ